ncbi:MAG: hypothetical protein V3W44_05120 [Dehalococcoidales bacterium]
MGVVHSMRVRYAEIAARVLAKVLLPGYPLNTVITVGWPSRRTTGSRLKTIGECAQHVADVKGSKNRTDLAHFISLHPTLYRDAGEVLHVLAHEMIHAVHPGAGHRGAFVRTARDIGLLAPWTATTPGPELKARLEEVNTTVLAEMGCEFPGGGADLMSAVKKQGIRQVKAVCGCGRIIRASRAVHEQGVIKCGICGSNFVVAEG